MRSFAPLSHMLDRVPGALVGQLGRIDTGRGREDLYTNQMPELLTRLAERARVQSITASSALEGIVVADVLRAAAIMAGSATSLRDRSEQELAGYRRSVDYLFTEDWRPANVGLLLHLHRLLFSETPDRGGAFKSSDNLVIDRSADGSRTVRFRPVPAAHTEQFVIELIGRYDDSVAAGVFHPVLMVGLFALDLLTIHPFVDGNGRVARVLTNALLADAGYGVTRYVSLEQLIAETADDYYDSLLASTHRWHDGEHDPWPWLSYFVGRLAAAYDRFERGAASERLAGTKQDRVRRYVLERSTEFFRMADIRAAMPGISDQTIRLALDRMRAEGVVRSEGTGRAARWRRLSGRPGPPAARPEKFGPGGTGGTAQAGVGIASARAAR